MSVVTSVTLRLCNFARREMSSIFARRFCLSGDRQSGDWYGLMAGTPSEFIRNFSAL